jgi:capsular exopolysaccharide synthesis family protein
MDQSNELDLIWIINVIWRRKWLIIGLLALAIFVSGAVMLYLPPTYKATATLMIEPSEKSTTSEINVLMAGERLALTYSQIIVSLPVLEQVVEELKLDITAGELERTITVQPIQDTHLLRVSVTNASPIWAVLQTNAIAEQFISYVDTLAAESYKKSLGYVQENIDQKQAEIDDVLVDIETQNNQHAELESILTELELQLTDNRDSYQILQQNAQALELSITQDTNKIHVVEPAQIENPGGYPPYTAVLLLFIDQDFISTNIASTEQLSTLIAQIFGPMLLRATLLDTVINQLELSDSPETLQERISFATIPGTQILELRVRDEEASVAIQIANTIASVFIEQLQRTLAEPYFVRLRAIESELNELTVQMADIQSEIKSISTSKSAVESELERLNNELTTKYMDRRELQNTHDQLVFEAERSANTVVISEPASQPSKQSQNSILYIGLSSIIACGLGAGLAFLLEHLEDKVRTQEDVAILLDQKPIGAIGHIEKGKDKLILGTNYSPLVAEDFRKLSAIIRPAIEGVPLHKLLVTSPNPGDGKSTIAANLALVLAKTGSKVLLVDADLHRPQLDKLFDIESNRGLSGLLSSNRNTTPIQITQHPNLMVLPCGDLPDDAIELLSSPKLGNALDTLAAKADLMIIDCPPILTLSDASFLTPLVDGVLLVINSGRTERKAAVEAMALLKMAKIQFTGIVLNGITTRSHSYYHYYGQEHQISESKTD